MPWQPNDVYRIMQELHMGILQRDDVRNYMDDMIHDEAQIAYVQRLLTELDTIDTQVASNPSPPQILELVGDIKFNPNGGANAGFHDRSAVLRGRLAATLGLNYYGYQKGTVRG